MQAFSIFRQSDEGTKALHNTWDQQGPWEVPSPAPCPEQVQPWDQTWLLRTLSYVVWKPSQEGNISLYPDPAAWLFLHGEKFFLNLAWTSPVSANVSCFPNRHHCAELVPVPVIHFCRHQDAVMCCEAIPVPTEPNQTQPHSHSSQDTCFNPAVSVASPELFLFLPLAQPGWIILGHAMLKTPHHILLPHVLRNVLLEDLLHDFYRGCSEAVMFP